MVAYGDAAFRQSDVSRLELGKVELPHRDRLCRLAAVLDVSPGELLARSGWAGAQTAFTSEEAPQKASIERTTWDAPSSVMRYCARSLTVVDPRGETLPSAGDLRRIREAIALAQDTRAHSREILAQSEALLERVMRPPRTPSVDVVLNHSRR
jgi:transcriptional regulator with XRE-family HTH domain